METEQFKRLSTRKPCRTMQGAVTDLAYNLHAGTTWSSIVKYGVVLVQESFLCVPQGGTLGGHFCPFSHRNFGNVLMRFFFCVPVF